MRSYEEDYISRPRASLWPKAVVTQYLGTGCSNRMLLQVATASPNHECLMMLSGDFSLPATLERKQVNAVSHIH
jgi:hypothetical protein